MQSLQYSLVKHAPCLKTRNIEETTQCRSVSPWMFLSFHCATGSLLLRMAPGGGCRAAALRHLALAMPAPVPLGVLLAN